MNKRVEDYKKLLRHHFYSFVRFSFNILEGESDYNSNWHIELLCDNLTDIESGKHNRLIVNQPPRTLKSFVISIAFIAWALGRNPKLKFLVVSGSQDLSSDLEDKFNKLVSHPRYKALFPQVMFNQGKTNFGGYRKALVINSSMMGLGADYIIIDDPLSPQKAQENSERDNINQIYDTNIKQRLNDKQNGKIIVAMQRLHENDLSGYILNKSESWRHISIPMYCCEDKEIKLSYGRVIKLKKNEPLLPTTDFLEQIQIMRQIGVENYCPQYLQFERKPSPSVLVYPSKYDSFEDWKSDNMEEYQDFILYQSHGFLVVPEQMNMEETIAKGEIMRKRLAEHHQKLLDS